MDEVEVGKGSVSLIEPLGSMTHVHFRIGEDTVVAETRADFEIPKLDDKLSICVKNKDFFFFDSAGALIE
jgi:ABC-type sugar transport system ATPase subunit